MITGSFWKKVIHLIYIYPFGWKYNIYIYIINIIFEYIDILYEYDIILTYSKKKKKTNITY